MDIMDTKNKPKDKRANWPRVQVEKGLWAQFKAAAALRDIPAYELLDGLLRVAVNSPEVLDAAKKNGSGKGDA